MTLLPVERATVTWAKIASFHIVFGMSGHRYLTLCGKQANGPVSETFPFDERTCESCLRIQARREQHGGGG